MLLHKVIAISRLRDATKNFAQVPTNSPFKKYIASMRNCLLTRLANKITRWFDDTGPPVKISTTVSRGRIPGYFS